MKETLSNVNLKLGINIAFPATLTTTAAKNNNNNDNRYFKFCLKVSNVTVRGWVDSFENGSLNQIRLIQNIGFLNEAQIKKIGKSFHTGDIIEEDNVNEGQMRLQNKREADYSIWRKKKTCITGGYDWGTEKPQNKTRGYNG